MRAPRPLARSTLALTLVLTLATPAAAHSQPPQQPLQLEGRFDGIFAHSSGVEAGIGVSVPAGIYVRSGFVAGIGAGRHGLEGRTDVLARFSLDPFRQSRWAPYGGAGVSARYRSRLDGGSRAYLLVLIGVEGPLRPDRMAGIVPAFEVGLGGGARVGVILRRGINARR